jgi:hypothetical protein
MNPGVASSALLVPLVRHLDARGAPTDAILAEAGLDPAMARAPDVVLPLASALRAFDVGGRVTGDPAIGLAAAVIADHRGYGVTGFVLANRATLREGFHDAIGVASALIPELRLQVEVLPGGRRFTMGLDLALPGARELTDEVLAGLCLAARSLIGVACVPTAVELPGPSRAPERYHEALGVPVTFEAERGAVTFADAELDRVVPGADPNLLVHLYEAVETQVAARRRAAGRSGDLVHLVGLTVDLGLGEVRAGGERVPLTDREHQLLTYFLSRANQLVHHADLERDVWDIGSGTLSYAPAVAIRRLRQKIELDPARPVNLVTVFGEGWKLVVPDQ